MSVTMTDVLVAGGGVAGLSAAAAFAAAGFGVICVDPAPPPPQAMDAPGADLRTTAILMPGIDLLEEAGLWQALKPAATPLTTLRLMDLGAGADGAPVARDFEAADLSDRPFGYNLPNWLIRREAVAHLERQPNARLWTGVGVTDVLPRDDAALVRLSDGRTISARLVVAADGRSSPTRAALGIGVRTTRYGQTALTFAVTHPHAHGDVSIEVYDHGGPFTLVPMPDHEGLPCSSVVWMDEAGEQDRRRTLPPDELAAEATRRSGGVLGPLSVVTAAQGWPVITQVADRLAARHLALVAEAAHVLPPIGAQGLNTSLNDIAELLALARDHRETLGSPEMLTRYERARLADIRLRARGVDLLNRLSRSTLAPVQALRRRGLALVHDATPIRRGIMRWGLGSGDA